MKILETERLILREATADDAAFVLGLLNQPSFKKFIGDRGVRNLDQAREYIRTRFSNSYRDNGFGLFLMELKNSAEPIGLCGFVRRDTLPDPDIGFALLPQFEKQGYAFEAASATMHYGRETLGLARVLAITTLDNEASGRLLEKIGLAFDSELELGGENLKLFSVEL
ncbi:MAG: GNAT family N-acetyltransferase [Acidobacteria bacterium]|nr:GNAT family N-acetyltransferase [Acidobacteriota bacterium]